MTQSSPKKPTTLVHGVILSELYASDLSKNDSPDLPAARFPFVKSPDVSLAFATMGLLSHIPKSYSASQRGEVRAIRKQHLVKFSQLPTLAVFLWQYPPLTKKGGYRDVLCLKTGKTSAWILGEAIALPAAMTEASCLKQEKCVLPADAWVYGQPKSFLLVTGLGSKVLREYLTLFSEDMGVVRDKCHRVSLQEKSPKKASKKAPKKPAKSGASGMITPTPPGLYPRTVAPTSTATAQPSA